MVSGLLSLLAFPRPRPVPSTCVNMWVELGDGTTHYKQCSIHVVVFSASINIIVAGLAEPVEKLWSQLLGILSDPRPPPTHPVGYLTSVERDQWAELREELCSQKDSADSLSMIDSAMFVLCLDDHEPTTIPDFTATMLHNYGANRYTLCIMCSIYCHTVLHTEGGLPWDFPTQSQLAPQALKTLSYTSYHLLPKQHQFPNLAILKP